MSQIVHEDLSYDFGGNIVNTMLIAIYPAMCPHQQAVFIRRCFITTDEIITASYITARLFVHPIFSLTKGAHKKKTARHSQYKN